MRILIVEDNASVAGALAELLRDSGYPRPQIAEYVREAERILTTRGPGLDGIIVDGRVPELRGSQQLSSTVDLVRRIRANGWRGVILAYPGDSDMLQRLIEAGCNGGAAKPDYRTLIKELRRLLPPESY